MEKQRPVMAVLYTYKEIVQSLELRDSPSLEFLHDKQWCVVQNSHCGHDAMLADPLWANSRWTYLGETDEWIPEFRFARENEISIEQLVNMEVSRDPYAEKRTMWVTPKGFPREQYYDLREDGKWVSESGEVHEPLVFDEKGYSHWYYTRVQNAGVCFYCKMDVTQRFKRKDWEEGSSEPARDVCAPCLHSLNAADKAAMADFHDYDDNDE